jgi:two-component system, sensor histidine kinase
MKLELEAAGNNVQLYGDTTRLNQIFSNLLSNAIKFTHSGGIKIVVSVIDVTGEQYVKY